MVLVNTVDIYVQYYVKDKDVILVLRRVITDKELIRRILLNLLNQGEYPARITLKNAYIGRCKITYLLKLL